MMIIGERPTSTATMRAAVHEAWGAPLEVRNVPQPEPRAGEVRIAVGATSVNPVDVFSGQHIGYEQSMELPFIPGWDVAGVVDAVGYGVVRHAVGDRVYGLAWFPHPAGTYAEYVTVPAHHVVVMPATATFAEAGSLPMVALTAWQMLEAAGVEPGQRVLVSGASGGVGHLAVQLAKAWGARVVALARSHQHELLRSLGADECVDYTDAAAIDAIGPVDALLDLVGRHLGAALFDHVVPGGSVALALGWSMPDHRERAAARDLRVASCLVDPDPEALTAIARLVDAGEVRVVVGAESDLDHAADAQRWVMERRGFGKSAIVVRDP